MKLPHRLNLCGSAREPNGAVIEIFECQAHHVRGQSLRQFTSVLHIQLESMLRQLSLNRMPRAAEFGVNRRFNDHSARRLVRGLGNLENHVAVVTVQAHFLQKSSREMEHLEFHSGSGRIEGTRSVCGQVYIVSIVISTGVITGMGTCLSAWRYSSPNSW